MNTTYTAKMIQQTSMDKLLANPVELCMISVVFKEQYPCGEGISLLELLLFLSDKNLESIEKAGQIQASYPTKEKYFLLQFFKEHIFHNDF